MPVRRRLMISQVEMAMKYLLPARETPAWIRSYTGPDPLPVKKAESQEVKLGEGLKSEKRVETALVQSLPEGCRCQVVVSTQGPTTPTTPANTTYNQIQ